jgi:aminoglycoside phosphotransferase (APT) family kinase protein
MYTQLEKSLRVEDHQQELNRPIAYGRTAEVYTWEDGKVLKLFYDWMPQHSVQVEFEVSRKLASARLPVPQVYDRVQISNRHGIIYERLTGPTLLSQLVGKPWLMRRWASILAEMHAQLHTGTGIDSLDGMPRMAESMVRDVLRAPHLEAGEKEKIAALIPGLPDGNVICHYDFHPDQILLTANGPVILDWMTARVGHPAADVARTLVILTYGIPPGAGWLLRQAVTVLAGLVRRSYLQQYLKLNPQVTLVQIQAWIVPVAAARLCEGIENETQPILRTIRGMLRRM